MLTALDHLVIAVRDLDAAAQSYARLLGRAPSWRGSHPRIGVFLASTDVPSTRGS